MAAFHSDEAFDRLKKLPKVKGKEIVEPNSATKNFRAFRKELVSRGAGGVRWGRYTQETTRLSAFSQVLFFIMLFDQRASQLR